MTTQPTNRIQTARRNIVFSVNLSKRRAWYTDPPAEPPAPPTPPVVPPTPDPKGDAKFTQAELDAIAGRTRKEATDSTTKKLLEALGADPTDEKALESIKALLAEGKQAKDAKKSAEEKLQEKIDALEQKAADAEAKATAAEEKRQATILDSKLETLARNVGAQFPEDVIEHARSKYADDVKALMTDDGIVDPKKAETLIAKIKTARPNFFNARVTNMGTGSHGGGRSGDINHEVEKGARAAERSRVRQG